MKKNILIRADSSSSIGTGHIMRDLVLAKQYPKKHVIFAVQDLQGNSNQKILEAGYSLSILQSNEFEELNRVIQKLAIDLLIIDHYDINSSFEKKLKKRNSHLKVLSLDDTYRQHSCDILLNHNIYAKKKLYKTLVSKSCKILCGAKYTLIREEFYKERAKKKEAHKEDSSTKIFLAMGGADSANLNIPILSVLEKFPNISIQLVTTTANSHLKELQKYVQAKPWIKLFVNSTKIAKLMRKSDFGIITPSVTANEAYFMRLPFLSIQTASNQKEMQKYLHKNNYLTLKKFSKQKFFATLQKMFFRLNDIQLKKFYTLTLQEKEMILKWRNHTSVRQWMFHTEPISMHNHFQFIDSLQNTQKKRYFLVEKNRKYIGVIDFTDIKKSQCFFGLYSNPSLKGVGDTLMQTIIDYAFTTLGVQSLKAEVIQKNTKALNLYLRYNFKISHTKFQEKILTLELKNANKSL